MLHIEYRKQSYKGSGIDIQPHNPWDIPELRDFVRHNLQIENPAKTAAEKIKSGEYKYSEIMSDSYTEADAAEILSKLWDGEPSMNAMMLLSRALQEILNLKRPHRWPRF